nr:PEP-CTERM sorting domain-containing protein [Gemmatimonadaceae bacterium]
VRTAFGANIGYNTTAGGQRLMGLANDEVGLTASLTFNFATPINFFGAYITGVERSCATYTASWGAASFVLPNSGNPTACSVGAAGIQWFGFRSTSSVTSVTFAEVRVAGFRDVIGIDDVIYGVVVPEPSTYVLLASGLAALAGVARRRQRRT